MSNPIFHWVYVSRASEDVDEKALDSLLREARTRNANRGITGVLIHVDSRFMQILEGSRENIESLSKSIIRDSRHTDIDTLRYEHKSQRDFADWRMAYARSGGGQHPEGFLPLLEGFCSTHMILKEHSESYFFVEAFRRLGSAGSEE